MKRSNLPRINQVDADLRRLSTMRNAVIHGGKLEVRAYGTPSDSDYIVVGTVAMERAEAIAWIDARVGNLQRDLSTLGVEE